MEGSSKECENTNKKVLVVKCNDFFTLKKITPRKEEAGDPRKSLSQNVSSISKTQGQIDKSPTVYSEAASSSQSSVSKPHSLKIVPMKCTVEDLQKQKYMRKVPVVEGGSEKTKLISFANLSKAKLTNGTHHITQTAPNANDTNDGELNADIVIDLINRKYGDVLEAQIPFFQQKKTTESLSAPIRADTDKKSPENKTTQGFPSKSSSDVYQYRAMEEQFLENLDNEQKTKNDIDKAKEHLETILILDSPEKDYDYKLFTRDELKRVPDKILESPLKPFVKQEISSPNKNHHQNVVVDVQLDNLKIKDEGNKTSQDVGQKIWEMAIKDINLETFADTTNSCGQNRKNDFELNQNHPTQCGKSMNQVSIADEDVILIEEMDKLIEEIKVENKNLTCVNSKDKLSLKPCENLKEDLNPSCVEYNVEVLESSEKSDKSKDEEKCKTLTKDNGIEESINKEEHVNLAESSSACAEEKTITQDEDEKKSSNILENLLLKSGICSEESIPEVSTSGAINETQCTENIDTHKDSSESLESTSESTTESKITVNDEVEAKNNTVSTNTDQIQQWKDVTTVSQSSYEEVNLNECSVLIVKEDGTLEPVDFDNDEPRIFYEKCQEQGNFSKGKNNVASSEISKEEILATVEKARAVQCKLNDNFATGVKIGKAKLKLFGSILKEEVKVCKELFGKLEIVTELAEKELEGKSKTEDLSNLQNNLFFVKDTMAKCFVREEKQKPKYKVVKITTTNSNEVKKDSGKEKTVVKKICDKKASKKKSANKLLQKTLFRMNKLLDVFEKNQKVVVDARRNTFVKKLKEVAKADNDNIKATEKGEKISKQGSSSEFNLSEAKDIAALQNTEINSDIRVSETKKVGILASDLEKFEKTFNARDTHKLMTVSLKKSDKVVTIDAETVTHEYNEQQLTSFSFEKVIEKGVEPDVLKTDQLFKSQTSTTVGYETETNGIIKASKKHDDKESRQKITKYKEKKDGQKIEQEGSRRYSLRLRKSSNIPLESNPVKYCKDVDIEKSPGYEVNYSNVIPLNKNEKTYDYFLRNDNKPCVVLYHKEQNQNVPIFDKAAVPAMKQNLRKSYKDDDIKDNVNNRYETRSKMLGEKRITKGKGLRSRKA